MRPGSVMGRGTGAVLVLLMVAAALILATGRELGHRMAVAVCSGAGDCGTFPESPPVCQYYGRDRVAAQETFAFAQQQAAPGARLIQFGDGSAEVLVSRAGAPADVYGFLRYQDAQHWVLDHSAELGSVADAAAGPSGQGIRDGYLTLLRRAGLEHESTVLPRAAAIALADDPLEGSIGAYRQSPDGEVSELTVLIPFDAASQQLKNLAERLGLWDFIGYTVELDENREPVKLTLSGPAAEGWSVDTLRAAPGDGRFLPADRRGPSGLAEGQVLVRSYSLDLRRQANATVYREAFSLGSVATTAGPVLSAEEDLDWLDRGELYGRLADRIRTDAVFIEAAHAVPGMAGDEDVLRRAAEGLVIRLGPEDAPDTRMADARTADLSIAESQPEPLLSCDLDAAGEEGA